MAEESGIYAEDIVKNSQGVVGLVLEDAEETTDESESDEEALKKGQIVVCWYPSGLSPLQDFIPGVHVSMGPWLGIVTEVYRKVVLRIKNGSRCSLEGEQSSMLYDLSDQRDEDSPFYSASFYPGQKVAGPARAFKEARWLSGVKPLIHNQAQIKGTVEEASVIACDVDWQVCGACQHCVDEDESLKPPDATVTQDQLHRSNQFIFVC
ncbi:(E3-independent) E2 ubiquitin-conjugating enzyme-like [Orbicella faveolata]|uniref:(E3-independent) E2 ubiquitin-conjugating enzyme-like n=1 Tax=Orbicella faveolata TaxID=48498 RepID=UPI0009E2B33B|nr:(E3-independent) E2 ubiquitin-conjugating enzyme-like [Orbicella faveolata]